MRPGSHRRWLLAAGVAVAVGAVLFFVFFRGGPSRPEGEGFDLSGGLHLASVPPAEGSDPAVGVRKLWVVRRGDRTAWDYHVLCADPEGCVGRIRLTFAFRAGGRLRRHSVVRTIALGRGGTLPDAFTLGQGLDVEEVESVEVRFLERLGEPRPTPTRTE